MWLVLLCALGCARPESSAQIATGDFEFVSGGRKLSGIVDQPVQGPARALVVFVHGSGGTDIRRENRYSDLRRRFGALGIACVTWDKPGQGRSEGVFDQNQPLEESAQEVLDAVAHLRQAKVPGAQKIGIWGTSRGGWVAPLALARDPEIRFWISVSGTPAEDNKYYLMKSNLPLEGRTPEQTEQLMREWVRGRRILIEGGSYATYLAATENLRKDPAVRYFAGDLTGSRQDYETEQAAYLKARDKFHLEPDTLSVIHIPDLAALLSRLNLDVLAVFGEKDTNLDWRRARSLYESTLGRNPRATLTVHTFPGANHSLNLSATGSVREVEGMPMDAGTKPAGYYDVQVAWLRKYVVPAE